jgi:hypothetical protein
MKAHKLLGAAVVAGAVIGVPAAALAQTDYVGGQSPQVRGVEVSRAPAGQGAPDAGGAGLPVTGGDVVGLTLLGAGAVALGTVLVRRGRTASATA